MRKFIYAAMLFAAMMFAPFVASAAAPDCEWTPEKSISTTVQAASSQGVETKVYLVTDEGKVNAIKEVLQAQAAAIGGKLSDFDTYLIILGNDGNGFAAVFKDKCFVNGGAQPFAANVTLLDAAGVKPEEGIDGKAYLNQPEADKSI